MMDMNETGKRRRLYLPLFLMAFLIVLLAAPVVASLDSRTNALQRMTVERPLPTQTPAVAYGASLDEWEEATQAESEPPAASSDTSPSGAEPSGSDMDSAASSAEPAPVEPDIPTIGGPYTYNGVVYKEMLWDGLLPADYSADAIMEKYAPQLAEFEDGSEEAMDLYLQMQEEFNNAPVNELLDGMMIRMPGFVAPLDYADEFITEFLLVPYFGACIHVPPPPVNQTVLVKAAEGQGIKAEDSFLPVWVMGRLAAEGTSTALAEAGYHIQDAIVEPYTGP